MSEVQNDEFELDNDKLKDNLIQILQNKVLELNQQNLLLQANFNTAFDELKETYKSLKELKNSDPLAVNLEDQTF